jgi:RHS repeat-associated protein
LYHAYLIVSRKYCRTAMRTDGLCSVTSLATAAGALGNTYTHNSSGNMTASSGSITNRFEYTAREFDSETGLYFYRARYYDPTTGRFLSEDPLELGGGSVNFYKYVHNNPVNSTDPTGFFPAGQDKWWGHNDPNFRWWWHRCYWIGEPYDGTKEDVELGWALWNGLGRPPKGKCPNQSPCKEPEPAPEPAPDPAPDKGPNWKMVGIGAGVAAGGIIIIVFCPECIVLAPVLAP